MGKVKRDAVKNIYCVTCDKFMTEFYVSRHIKTKYHFTEKFFDKQYLKKTKSKKQAVEEKRTPI